MSIIAISGRIGSGKDTVAKMIQYLMCVKQFGPDDGFRLDSSRNYAIGGWENRKFATKLKLIVSMFTGFSVQDLEFESVKNSELGPGWNYAYYSDYRTYESSTKGKTVVDGPRPMTIRDLLQRLGTDALRDKVHPNIHVNGLFADYKPSTCKNQSIYCSEDQEEVCHKGFNYGCYPNWIISDLRFPNEAQAVVDRQGITLRVERRPSVYLSSDDDLLSAAGKQYKEEFLKPHPSETALDDYKFDYVIHNNGTIDDLLEEVRKFLIHFNLI